MPPKTKEETNLEESVEKLSLENSSDENNNKNVDETVQDNKEEVVQEGEEENKEQDDDNEGWINPSNLEQFKKTSLVESEEQELTNMKLKVACMTADFSMQVFN